MRHKLTKLPMMVNLPTYFLELFLRDCSPMICENIFSEKNIIHSEIIRSIILKLTTLLKLANKEMKYLMQSTDSPSKF